MKHKILLLPVLVAALLLSSCIDFNIDGLDNNTSYESSIQISEIERQMKI